MTISSRLPYAFKAFPTISSDLPKPYTGAVSMMLTPLSRAVWMVLMDWVSSVPPHIQPPIAQVPRATRVSCLSSPGMRMYSIGLTSFSSCPSINGQFAQFLCQAQILILNILRVCLRLKFSPSLNLNKLSYLWTDTSSCPSINGQFAQFLCQAQILLG